MQSIERPYVLFVAHEIYLSICKIKKKNPHFSNSEAIENFIGSKTYLKISSGKFHEDWFKDLKKIILLIKKQENKYLKKL